MKYRTLENNGQVCLRRERRSGEQYNKLPLEDLNGNKIVNERRIIPDHRTDGLEVIETNLSQDEFQKHFKDYHH